MKKKRTRAGPSRANSQAMRALFVEAYVENGGNGMEAAITAGFSPKSAKSKASHLLKVPKIKAAIEKRRAEVLEKAQEKTDLTIEGTLRELHGIVHSDLRKCFDQQTGALLPPHKWPDDVAKAMASVKVVEMAGGMKVDAGEGSVEHVPMYTKEVKFWDKNSAIEKAMKHLGLFEKDNVQQPPTVLISGQKTVKFERFKGRGRSAQA